MGFSEKETWLRKEMTFHNTVGNKLWCNSADHFQKEQRYWKKLNSRIKTEPFTFTIYDSTPSFSSSYTISTAAIQWWMLREFSSQVVILKCRRSFKKRSQVRWTLIYFSSFRKTNQKIQRRMTELSGSSAVCCIPHGQVKTKIWQKIWAICME